MIKHKLNLALCATTALFTSIASFASGSHQKLFPKLPTRPTREHRHGRSPSPADSVPYIIPYACGDNVTSILSHTSLIVKSDAGFDAGFILESDPSSTNVPFGPGQLSFSIQGAKPGDQLAVFETDVNGFTNGTSSVFVTNNVYSLNLATLTQANIKQLSCVFSQKSGSTIVLNTFQLNDINLPLNVSQTIGCSDVSK